jgi:ABC-type multidrug transport system fused ATPase/permease subunit
MAFYKTKNDEQNMSWGKILKSLWYFVEKDKIKLVIFSTILFIVLSYSLVPAYVVGKIVDFFNNYSQGDSLKPFYQYIIFLGVSYLVVSLIRLYSKQVVAVIGQKCRVRARILGFERLTEFSLEWHNKENSGNKIQRIFTGSDSIKQLMVLLGDRMFGMFVNSIGALIIFIFVDIKLFILVSIYFTIYIIVEFVFSRKLFLLSNEFNKLNQSAGGVYVESANNMFSIKALGGESGVNMRVASNEEKSRDISIQREKAFYTKWFFFQFVNGLTLVAFLLILGNGVMNKSITIGMILVFFTYYIKLRDVLGDMSDLHTTLLDIRSGIGQMMPIFEQTEFIKKGNERFPQGWDKIEIKNASMEYGSGQAGIKDFNLVLNRNSKVGIAGSSGSGKSTLAKIILGLYAIKSGTFKIGGEDYYSISHNETLGNVTVVLQETELFNLSLRENITMMRNLDVGLLNQAVEISQLKEVIDKLPNGLDSLIGEKGYMLSGGERQRLGIARAIYKDAPIVILDEATSSLDSETEGRVMEKLLGEYGKEKTFLIIAHRLGTLRYTNTISVMESGKVVENGSYEKLMNDKNSFFHKMNQEQKYFN